jgi:hypothetical protein
MFSGLLR